MNEQYQEIDLLELSQKILKRWWVILILGVFFGLLAFTVSKATLVPIYQANSTFFIGKEQGGLSNLSLSDLQVGNKLAVDYQELIKTNLVVEEVINVMNLDLTISQFKSNIGVRTIEESRFMNLFYKDTDPERAKAVVNELSEILAVKAVEIVGVESIQIVDYAKLPLSPIGSGLKKNTAVGAVLGIVLALFLIFIEMILKDSINTEEEIEKLLGIPVLGSIPKFKGEKRSA